MKNRTHAVKFGTDKQEGSSKICHNGTGIELLNKRGIEYRKTNNPTEILISCTSGEHTDKSPSLSYNLERNVFHCWSCGFSGGINKVYEVYRRDRNT
jgi:hypothetical protein